MEKDDLTADQLAQRFHEAYERLAPSFGYETREASRKPWEDVPENNRRLMAAVCAEVGETWLAEVARLAAANEKLHGRFTESAITLGNVQENLDYLGGQYEAYQHERDAELAEARAELDRKAAVVEAAKVIAANLADQDPEHLDMNELELLHCVRALEPAAAGDTTVPADGGKEATP